MAGSRQMYLPHCFVGVLVTSRTKCREEKKQLLILQDTTSSNFVLLRKESSTHASIDLLRRKRTAGNEKKREEATRLAHLDLESNEFASGTARTIPRPQPWRRPSERV